MAVRTVSRDLRGEGGVKNKIKNRFKHSDSGMPATHENLGTAAAMPSSAQHYQHPPKSSAIIEQITVCYAIVLPGRKSVFRARFQPDSNRESLKNGPPAGR